jgi:hypothetical protein
LLEPSDPKHISAVLLDGDAIVVALEIVRAAWKRGNCQRAERVTAVISDRGLDRTHVTR